MRLLRLALTYELGMWRSLFRWLLVRPRASGPGAEAFGYTSTLMPLLLAFIVVSAIELPILHLLLPWETVRLIVDIISGYGLVWMIGLLAIVRMHPHVVNDDCLQVRQGLAVDATIPWADVATVRARHRTVGERGAVVFETTDAGLVAVVGVLRQTTVDITLRTPTEVALPKRDGRPREIVELRLYADDPAAFVASARQRLRGPGPVGPGRVEPGLDRTR